MVKEKQRKAEIRRQLTQLTQFKNNKKALEEAVDKKYNDELFWLEWDYDIHIPEERDFYQKIVHKYLDVGRIENSSDKEFLKQLCYLELVNYRIRRTLNEFSSKKVPAPAKELDSLNKNVEQIQKAKQKLGLIGDKEDEQDNDFVRVMSTLQERFEKVINDPDQRANYTTRCPYCSELYLIRRRIDKEKDVILQHPWFVRGGLLFNKEIFKDYIDGTITKEQVIRYLDTNEDYLNWLYKNYRLELFESLKEGK